MFVLVIISYNQTDFNGGPPSPKRPKSAEPSGERSNGSGPSGGGGGDGVSSADGGIIDADEDDQLAAAIKASLAESEAAKSHTNRGKPSTGTFGNRSSALLPKCANSGFGAI